MGKQFQGRPQSANVSTADAYNSSEFKELMAKPVMAKPVTFTTIESNREITITPAQVLRFLAKPTKQGRWPTENDCVKFCKLCEARQLDPWQGDAFLVGYDGHDGPEFSLITSVQAMFKRAEASPKFRGMEQGVILAGAEKGTLTYRKGDFVLPGEVLLGGWAKAYIDGWDVPCEDALSLAVFNKGYSQWKSNPAGMIVKCAQASVLRTAFPSQLSALYCREEMGDSFKELMSRKLRSQEGQPLPRTISDLVGPPKTEKTQAGAVTPPAAEENQGDDPGGDEQGNYGDEEGGVEDTTPPKQSTFDEAKAIKLFAACKTRDEIIGVGNSLINTTNPTESERQAIGGMEMEALQRVEKAAK